MSLFNISDRDIQSLAYSKKSYDLGIIYDLNKKVTNFIFTPNRALITANVLGNWNYDIKITLNNEGQIQTYACTCPAFTEYPGACKHIVAVLKTAQRKIPAQYRSGYSKIHFRNYSTANQLKADYRAASDFLSLFADSKLESPLEELNLEIELQINTAYQQPVAQLQLRVGLSRLYIIKNLYEFLTAFKTGQSIRFGVKFTYDPTRHTFNKNDLPIITMLQEMLEQHRAVHQINSSYFYTPTPFSQKPFVLSQYYLSKLLDALGEKTFYLKTCSTKVPNSTKAKLTQIVRHDVPLDFSLKNKADDLTLALKSSLPIQLTDDGNYYLYEQGIYRSSPRQSVLLPNLIKILTRKPKTAIRLSEEQKDIFASEALPLIQKLGSVAIEPNLAKKFVHEDLQAKIYFDKLGDNGITARLEFHYGNVLINPFSAPEGTEDSALSKDHILIRDLDQERKILAILEQADFTVFSGKINLEDSEKIFDFTVHWLQQLQDFAETFYSDDFKLTIRTNTSFSGHIRLDESLDMLEISFAYNDIDQAELADIFQSLQTKKKYYRLRDGSFLDLKQPELETIADLMDHLDLKNTDFQKEMLLLPKFRAMYIDSFLRQANLPNIQRDKAFKQLVQSILDPQDGEFELPPSLNNILRDYQKTGFKWLKTLASYGLGGILADDMGLGKTLQVLAFILSEKFSSAAAPSLVIAPTSLIYNWQSEGEKFTPDLKILVLEGTPQERQEMLNTIDQWDMIVASYAIVRRDVDQLSLIDFSYCFLDEAQNIKNPQTLNAKSVQRIKAKGYFALTGTPIENSLSELWSIINFLMPHYLHSHKEFHKKYAIPITKGDSEALLELIRHIKPFILRRLKKDVLKELPPKIETEIKAALTDEQRKIYLAYLQQTKSQIAQELSTSGFAKSQIKILAALTRLRQICCHPAMFIDNYQGESGKMQLFGEILADSLAGGHRMLVFSQFTSMLDIIGRHLDAQNIEYFYLSGSTKASKRIQMAHSFNNGRAAVFLISLKAGGTGLNLTGADMVIHFDPWWNPAVEDQATDRAHRIGQNHSVQVIKLLTQGTIEEKVNALQSKKKKLIDSVIQPGETMLSRLTEQELRELFEIQ